MQHQAHSSADHGISSRTSTRHPSIGPENFSGPYNSNTQSTQRMLDPNPSINELRRLIPAIGMDRDTRDSSFSKIIHSPTADSTSRSTGVETNSETSLRSPSGLSSLPSIGSPSSISSPPQTSSCAASNYLEAPIPIISSGSGTSDWLRKNNHAGMGMSSAFKPLPTSASSLSSYYVTPSPKRFDRAFDMSSNHYTVSGGDDVGNNFAPVSINNIMDINTNINSVISNQSQVNRTRVGADPRDAKNPLSISQLTGNTNANDQLLESRTYNSKSFMNSNGTLSVDGLTVIDETTNRDHIPRKNFVDEKLNRTLTADRISSLIV